MARRLLPGLVVLLILLPCGAQESLFDSDPKHPWNRLHRHLYARTMQDGKTYDHESLETLFLPTSKFLVSGPSHREVLALLDEFLKDRADRRIKDPLKRALLQRDLWAVFTTTSGWVHQQVRINQKGRVTTTDRHQDVGDTALPFPAQRRALQKRLVQALRRLALRAEEIAALPDNLTAAVRSGAFPRAYDPNHPRRPFLPPDLLAGDGSWVVVTNPTREPNGAPAAPAHAAFTKGRSLFLVLLRLPQGRKATETYLKTLQNGALSQFPEGTQTALVRRTLLIDSTGQLRVAPLTENVQLRVFRKLDEGDAFEFTLRRSDLIAGRHGGLRPVRADETSYFDFQTRSGDVFEMKKPPPAPVILKNCVGCHGRVEAKGGIYSVNTIYNRGLDEESPGLMPSGLREEARAVLNWTRKTYSWGLLQGLWQAGPAR
jgi:hypothetical protein